MKSRKPASYRPPISGTIRANMQMPVSLHEAMKAIRDARHKLEGADVRLCRIYAEAVQQYIQADAQQELLNHTRRKRARAMA